MQIQSHDQLIQAARAAGLTVEATEHGHVDITRNRNRRIRIHDDTTILLTSARCDPAKHISVKEAAAALRLGNQDDFLSNTDRLVQQLAHAQRHGAAELVFRVGKATGNGPSVIAALRRRGYIVDRVPASLGTYRMKAAAKL